MNSNGKMQVHYSSARQEWLTPADILDRVLEVMGRIDLDPACNVEGLANVPAGAHYKPPAQDGLALPWPGKIYLNPPYGREIGLWIDKAIQELEAGRMEQGILLLPARVDTRWYGKLTPYTQCFVRGRLKFSGHDNSAPFPSVLVHMCQERSSQEDLLFGQVFYEIGNIAIFALGEAA